MNKPYGTFGLVDMLTACARAFHSLNDYVGRVDLGNVPAGTFTTVLLPNALKAYKDDGFGGKVPFELNNGITGSGANGATVTLGGVEYNVYGEFNLVAGKTFIYIEE